MYTKSIFWLITMMSSHTHSHSFSHAELLYENYFVSHYFFFFFSPFSKNHFFFAKASFDYSIYMALTYWRWALISMRLDDHINSYKETAIYCLSTQFVYTSYVDLKQHLCRALDRASCWTSAAACTRRRPRTCWGNFGAGWSDPDRSTATARSPYPCTLFAV